VLSYTVLQAVALYLALFQRPTPLHPVHGVRRRTADGGMGWAAPRSAERLVLDVYSPNNEFSRRGPDPIQFSICICVGGAPPPFAALVAVGETVPHPVKMANVMDGIVTLFGLIPTQV
jgi:hypothetical protein